MENEDKYPKGLRVLLVDDDIICLKILEKLLQACQYTVTITDNAAVGLKMLRENSDNFDIVISDVNMPGMDGFTLLEHISKELDIPVIMVSAYEDPEMVMKGVKKGAVDYLVKPARLLELKNIWQHVVRRNMQKQQKEKAVVRANVIAEEGNNEEEEEEEEEDEEKKQEQESLDNPIVKKKDKNRVVWCPMLHKKFVDAVNKLGLQNALPKKILEHMNVEGLTRANVASHLQKYKLHIKRWSDTSNSNPLGQCSYHNIYGESLLRSHRSFPKACRPHQSAASLLQMLNSIPRSNLSQPPRTILHHNSSFIKMNPPPPPPPNNNNHIQINGSFINPIPQEDQTHFANFNNVVSNIGVTQFQTPTINPQPNINGATNVSAAYNNNYNQVVPFFGSSSPEFGDISSVDFNDDIGPFLEQLNDDLGLMEANNNEGLTIEQLSDSTDLIETSFLDGFSIDDNFEFEGSEFLAGLSNN